MRILLITLLAVFVVGCTTPNHQLLDNAQQVHIRMDSGFDATQCKWLGEATGTEGSWYSSWLYPNDILIAGAISDLKKSCLSIRRRYHLCRGSSSFSNLCNSVR